MAENKDDGELKRHLLSRAEVLHGTGSGEGASGKKVVIYIYIYYRNFR